MCNNLPQISWLKTAILFCSFLGGSGIWEQLGWMVLAWDLSVGMRCHRDCCHLKAGPGWMLKMTLNICSWYWLFAGSTTQGCWIQNLLVAVPYGLASWQHGDFLIVALVTWQLWAPSKCCSEQDKSHSAFYNLVWRVIEHACSILIAEVATRSA